MAGRYRIAGLLGRGGMGEVYRAEDFKLGQAVALKFLPKAARYDDVSLALLADEVRIARAISHSNVCRVYDVGEADGQHFLSMEYIDGEDLGSLLRRVDRLPRAKAADIARQLCEGLAAVHEQGVLHRDLKPSNVMIDGDGHARLTDFGLAAAAGADARGGTPAYMAPEQVDGEVSVKSDLYALGLVLYELTTGQPAFQARNPSERLHKETAPRPPSELVDDVDPVTDRVILQCLEKDPDSRPASARAVAVALADSGTRERPPTGPAGQPPWHGAKAEPAPALRLRRWPPPRLPERPYPVLLPYNHPALLAGRDRELTELLRRLRLPVPILGVYATSGTGKSSFLSAGLVPALRRQVPVALVRHPQEPALAERLLGDLLEIDAPDGTVSSPPDPSKGTPRAVVEALRAAALLAGEAPVLVVDQFEELMRSGDSRSGNLRSRSLLGILLAACAAQQRAAQGPLCRWVLAYRQEFHGDVVAWLGDVLAEARADGEDVAELPHDLAGPDRFQFMQLTPLGTPPPRSDPLSETERIFLDAIEKPLALMRPTGKPRYPWRFVPGHARVAWRGRSPRLALPDLTRRSPRSYRWCWHTCWRGRTRRGSSRCPRIPAR